MDIVLLMARVQQAIFQMQLREKEKVLINSNGLLYKPIFWGLAHWVRALL